MYMKSFFGVLFLVVLTFASCKKDEPLTPTNGIYRGVFNRIFEGPDTMGTGIVHLAMKESDSTFILTGDTTSNAPFTSKGTYKLTPGKIEFINTTDIEEYAIDPYYDPHYVLDTIYDYEFLDTTFTIELNLGTVLYQYKLTRI